MGKRYRRSSTVESPTCAKSAARRGPTPFRNCSGVASASVVIKRDSASAHYVWRNEPKIVLNYQRFCRRDTSLRAASAGGGSLRESTAESGRSLRSSAGRRLGLIPAVGLSSAHQQIDLAPFHLLLEQTKSGLLPQVERLIDPIERLPDLAPHAD